MNVTAICPYISAMLDQDLHHIIMSHSGSQVEGGPASVCVCVCVCVCGVWCVYGVCVGGSCLCM